MPIFRRSDADAAGGTSRDDSLAEGNVQPNSGPRTLADSAYPPAMPVDSVDASAGALVAPMSPASDGKGRFAHHVAPPLPHAADDVLAYPEVPERERRREQRLVEAACRGEESAIEALYRTHFDTVYRYIFLRLGSPSAAEDVTSQVFLGMVRGLGRYRDEGKPFVAWLYGMARKQIAFYQRGMSRTPNAVDLEVAAELVAQTAGPHASAEERELRVAIARGLAKVPEGQREVLMLRYVLAMSLADTAAAVGRTEGAVKQLQLRGLASLKIILSREGVDLS